MSESSYTEPEVGAIVPAHGGQEADYVIPLKYRMMENGHIVFWILKDIGWCLIWKPLGLAMIAPTLIISLVIAWRTRHLVSELCHNIAISAWITANSYWMISEFFAFDALIFWNGITYKHLALIPFGIGALTLLWYYVFLREPSPSKAA